MTSFETQPLGLFQSIADQPAEWQDKSRIRARHAPANNATLNNIALAIVFHRGFRHLPEANLHFLMRPLEALDAILSPS